MTCAWKNAWHLGLLNKPTARIINKGQQGDLRSRNGGKEVNDLATRAACYFCILGTAFLFYADAMQANSNGKSDRLRLSFHLTHC